MTGEVVRLSSHCATSPIKYMYRRRIILYNLLQFYLTELDKVTNNSKGTQYLFDIPL